MKKQIVPKFEDFIFEGGQKPATTLFEAKKLIDDCYKAVKAHQGLKIISKPGKDFSVREGDEIGYGFDFKSKKPIVEPERHKGEIGEYCVFWTQEDAEIGVQFYFDNNGHDESIMFVDDLMMGLDYQINGDKPANEKLDEGIKHVKTDNDIEKFVEDWEMDLRDIWNGNGYEELDDGFERAIKDLQSVHKIKIDKKVDIDRIVNDVYWFF